MKRFRVLKAFEFGDEEYKIGDILNLNVDDSEESKKTADEWVEKGIVEDCDDPKPKNKSTDDDDGKNKGAGDKGVEGDNNDDPDAKLKKMVTDAVAMALSLESNGKKKGVPDVKVVKETWTEDPNWGWASQGEFARAVYLREVNKSVDPRLVRQERAGDVGDLVFNVPMDLQKTLGTSRVIWKAPTVETRTDNAEAASNLLAPGFLFEVLRHVYREASLMAQARLLPMVTNSMDIPSDETYPWGTDDTAGTGNRGVRAEWTDEGNAITQSKVKILRQTVKPHNLAVLVPVTDQMLADQSAVSLDAYIGARAGEDLSWETDFAILNAAWTSSPDRPDGVLHANNTALHEVQATAADTITGDEVVDLLAEMYSQCTSPERAVWVINHEFWPLLIKAKVGDTPVWMPSGGISGSPFGSLWARPIIMHQAMPANPASTEQGGVAFIDFSGGYVVGTRGGVQSAVSIHLYFDTMHTAFRYAMRVDGKTVFKNKVSAAQTGSTDKSPYVIYGVA